MKYASLIIVSFAISFLTVLQFDDAEASDTNCLNLQFANFKRFHGCVFTTWIQTNTSCRHCDFDGAVFNGNNFGGTDFSGAKFTNSISGALWTNWKNAKFDSTTISGGKLIGFFDGASFKSANIQNFGFDSPFSSSSQFDNNDWSNSVLTNVELRMFTPEGTNLIRNQNFHHVSFDNVRVTSTGDPLFWDPDTTNFNHALFKNAPGDFKLAFVFYDTGVGLLECEGEAFRFHLPTCSYVTPPTIGPLHTRTVEATAAVTPLSEIPDLPTASYTRYFTNIVPVVCNPNGLVLGANTVTCSADPPSATESFSAFSTWGNPPVGSASFNVNVIDTTDPVVTDPPDITVEATGPMTPLSDISLGTPTAIDASPVTFTNDAPAQFPLGTTEVHWTGTDTSGNSATTTTQRVTVVDTTPPDVEAPPTTHEIDIHLSIIPGDDVDLVEPIVTDLVDPNPVVTNNAPDSYPFEGTTTVTWEATDFSGNTGDDTQSVTIVPNDNDNDKIVNGIDTMPDDFSKDFDDSSFGGGTTGTLVDQGDQDVTIYEEPGPDGVFFIANDDTSDNTIAVVNANNNDNDSIFDFTGPYEMQNWSSFGISGGTTTINPSSGPTTTAEFSYDVNRGNPGPGVPFRTSTFPTTADQTGTVTFDWQYDLFHAFAGPP